MRNKLLLEAVGTFFLCLAGLVGGGPLPVAALFCALIYMGAPVALPHYNPAVSLAFRLRGRIGSRALGAAVGVQLLAAIAAALVAGAMLGHDAERAKGAVDALAEPAFEGFLSSATIELLGTFLLAFVFLMVGTSRLTAGNSYFGFAIALASLGLAGVFSDFGTSLNPASALASCLFGTCAALFEGLAGTKAFVTETLYLAKVAPRVAAEVGVQFLGAALAAWFFRYLFPEDR
jgi:aquaporin Z